MAPIATRDRITSRHSCKGVGLDCLQLMLDHGADITAMDDDGQTALHYAVHNSRLDVVQFVVDQGIDIELTDADSFSALHTALECNNLDACEFLMKRGADVNKRDGYDETPLGMAVDSDRGEAFVRVLLKYGANVRDQVHGESVLGTAMTRSSSGVVKLLIQQLARLTHCKLSIGERDREIMVNNHDCQECYEKCVQEFEGMEVDEENAFAASL